MEGKSKGSIANPQPKNGLRAQRSEKKRYGMGGGRGPKFWSQEKRGQLVQFLWVWRRECISKLKGRGYHWAPLEEIGQALTLAEGWLRAQGALRECHC